MTTVKAISGNTQGDSTLQSIKGVGTVGYGSTLAHQINHASQASSGIVGTTGGAASDDEQTSPEFNFSLFGTPSQQDY
jgi:hypothetical protein